MSSGRTRSERSQVNIRIPVTLKKKAQKKAADMHLSLSFVVTHFLEKFAEENIIQIRTDVDFDKIFDEGIIAYAASEKGKNMLDRVGSKVKKVMKQVK